MLRLQTMLGGVGAQIGWLLLGFGSIFFWVFAWNADLSGWRFRADSLARTSGVSLGCGPTRFSQGPKYHPHVVYRNLYRYTAEGQSYEGESYAPKCRARGPVAVEYLRLDPGISRIAGMRRRPMPAATALVALLPAVGLCLVIAGLLKGRWKVRLLRDGLPASGRIAGKAPTGSTINGRAVYRVTVEYTPWDGPPSTAAVRTSRPERLENSPETLVLYDPANHSRALVFQSLSGVRFDRDGQPARSGSLAFLFLPLATIAGNGCYVYTCWIG